MVHVGHGHKLPTIQSGLGSYIPPEQNFMIIPKLFSDPIHYEQLMPTVFYMIPMSQFLPIYILNKTKFSSFKSLILTSSITQFHYPNLSS